VKRVVVLGRGAAGKSVFARALSRATGIPCTELDEVFWSEHLRPMRQDAWHDTQEVLVRPERRILYGDLGPYDAAEPRLRAADTVVVFDVSLMVCSWRAIRRSRERVDFWRWLLAWRRRYRPVLLQAIRTIAPTADLLVVRNRHDAERVLRELTRRSTANGDGEL